LDVVWVLGPERCQSDWAEAPAVSGHAAQNSAINKCTRDTTHDSPPLEQRHTLENGDDANPKAARSRVERHEPAIRGVPNDPARSVDLLGLAQAGDEQARDDLLARYLPRLERWASRRLPLGVPEHAGHRRHRSGAVIGSAAAPRTTTRCATDKTFEQYR
jgi:hypothetical protein